MSDRAFDGLESLEDRLSMSVVLWTGGGDGVTLNSRFNWQCNHLPDSGDTAIVDVAGVKSLSMSSGSFTPYKLVFAEQLAFTGGTIDVGLGGTTLSGGMTIAGGTFKGSGALAVTGALRWTAGQISGTGKITIAAGAQMDLEGTSVLDLRRTIDNRGRINWLGGNIDTNGTTNSCGGSSATITLTNEPGAVFRATGTGRLRAATGSAAVDNKGTFVRDTDGRTLFTVAFRNSGTLNTAGGTLALWGGGTNSGPRNIAAGATLHYFGNFTEAAGSTLVGGGDTIWQGGTHTITGAWAMSSYLYLSNATVDGAAVWTIDGVLGWSHGTLQGTGGTVIGPTGKIEVRTLGAHTLARDILNNGVIVWNRGPLTMAGATITNPAGQAVYIAADAVAVSATGVNRIVNHGEIRKVLPTNAGFGGVVLDSDGLVNVHNGNLTLDAGAVAQLSAGTLSGGAWSVFGTAVLSMSGQMIRTVGAGAFVERIGINAGFAALDGLTRNEGTVRIIGGGFLDLSPEGGTFTNAGALVLGNMTAVRVGGDFVQESTGVLTVGLGAPLSLSSGRVIVANNATLGGSVQVMLELGYVPQAGDEFFILGAAAAEGQFSGVPSLDGLSTEFEYLPGAVILRFV